jgi:hypothetical protein
MALNAKDETSRRSKRILNAYILQETTFRLSWTDWVNRHIRDPDWRNGAVGDNDDERDNEILDRSLAHLPTFSSNKYDNRFVIWELSDAWKKGG